MFEEKLLKLDGIVKNLEEGKQSLDQNLDSFQEGMKLIKECQKQLKDAELRVKEIVENQQSELEEKDLVS